jgi:hypothetical protein
VDPKPIFDWLEATPVAQLMQMTAWAFPAVEVIHVIAIVLVYGIIAIVDLRLIGLAGHSRRYADLTDEALHWVWLAFVVALISGSLMFVSQANAYWGNWYFKTKLVFIFFAGINMLIMEFVFSRNRREWGTGRGSIPYPARLAGTLSLTFWTVVLVCGRWIGFTMFAMPDF